MSARAFVWMGIAAICLSAIVGFALPGAKVREGPIQACIHSAIQPDGERASEQPIAVEQRWLPPTVTCIYPAEVGGTVEQVVPLVSSAVFFTALAIGVAGVALVGYGLGAGRLSRAVPSPASGMPRTLRTERRHARSSGDGEGT